MAYDPATQLPAYTPAAAPGNTLAVADHDVSLHQLDRQELRGLKSDFGLTAASTDRLHYVRRSDAAGLGLWVPDASVGPSPILNGNFNVWQAGTTFTSIADAAYGPDGWAYRKAGAVVHDLLRSTDVPAVATPHAPLANYSLHLDVTTADASLASTDCCFIEHRMEGFNWGFFAQRQFAIGFWVKAAKTGTHAVAFRNGVTPDRSYIGTYTISVADTWEWKQIVVSASPSGGTWDYTTGLGLCISWVLSAGSTFLNGSAGSWQTGNYLAPSGYTTNETDSTSNNFKLYGVTMALGPHAPAMAFRPFQAELALAERYYAKTFPYVTTPAQNSGFAGNALRYSVVVAGANANSVVWQFPQRMRTSPTVTTYNPSAANTNWRNFSDGADSGASAAVGTNDARVQITNAQAAGDGVGESLGIHATADARL